MRVGIIISSLVTLVLCFQSAAQQRPVYVTASLIDENNLFIENLEKEEVQIFEEGEPRTIEFMAQEELPTIYGLIFDRTILGAFPDEEDRRKTDFSRTPQARSLAYELIDKFLGQHALWIGYYDNGLDVVLDYTLNGQRAKETIQQMRGSTTGGESFLYSALLSSVRKMNQHHEKRRVLILLLNSLDIQSAGKLKPMKNLLSRSNIELFIVSFTSPSTSNSYQLSPPMSKYSLKELADSTAGDSFFIMDYGDHQEDLTRRLINHMRTLYTFGFVSTSAYDGSGDFKIQCTIEGSKVKTHPFVPYLP